MTGICAGIQGKARIGDAIFIDPSWDWQSGKYIREAEDLPRFLISPHQVGPTPAARAFAEQLKQDRELLSRIGNEGPDEPPNVLRLLIGPVASGSAVVADEGVTSEIRLQNRDTIRVEMEGYGFFVAAEGGSGPKPIALAIKAVCDLADSLKNDKYQRYASYVSAQILRHYIERYGPALLGINRR
jgi:nucleoside phosphorylase